MLFRSIAVSQQLAQAIVRDGEGATKFITVKVEGGRDEAECQLAAYAIAAYLRPGEKIPFEYTTASPRLQLRLGV